MIVVAILAVLTAVLSFVFGLLPEFNPPDTTEWAQAFADLGSKLSVVNGWIDLALLTTLLGLMASILVVYAAVKAVLWVAARIPGIGGGDG